jgi:methionyl aminopeptidase
MDLQYEQGRFPVGHLVDYRDNDSWRATSEEAKEKERLLEYDYDGMRKAAECHR